MEDLVVYMGVVHGHAPFLLWQYRHKKEDHMILSDSFATPTITHEDSVLVDVTPPERAFGPLLGETREHRLPGRWYAHWMWVGRRYIRVWVQ